MSIKPVVSSAVINNIIDYSFDSDSDEFWQLINHIYTHIYALIL